MVDPRRFGPSWMERQAFFQAKAPARHERSLLLGLEGLSFRASRWRDGAMARCGDRGARLPRLATGGIALGSLCFV